MGGLRTNIQTEVTVTEQNSELQTQQSDLKRQRSVRKQQSCTSIASGSQRNVSFNNLRRR